MPTEKIECPLCLGEGELTRAEVLDRLGVKDFARVAQLSAEEAFRLLQGQYRHGLLPEEQESGLARCRYLLMTNKIDQGVARRRQQPGLGILWHAVSRPGHECGDQRIAEGVLGAGHVARVRGKVC